MQEDYRMTLEIGLRLASEGLSLTDRTKRCDSCRAVRVIPSGNASSHQALPVSSIGTVEQ